MVLSRKKRSMVQSAKSSLSAIPHIARVLVSREGEVTLLGPVDIGASGDFPVMQHVCEYPDLLLIVNLGRSFLQPRREAHI